MTKNTEKTVTAWWISNSKGVLRFKDKRVAKPGITHTVPKDKVEVRKGGLHAWSTLYDSLKHLEDNEVFNKQTLWKVELKDPKTYNDYELDLLASHSRKYIYKVERPLPVLRSFLFKKTIEVVDKNALELPDALLEYLKAPDPKKHSSFKALRSKINHANTWHNRGSGVSSTYVASLIMNCIPKLVREEYPTTGSLLSLMNFCYTEEQDSCWRVRDTDKEKEVHQEFLKLLKKPKNEIQRTLVKILNDANPHHYANPVHNTVRMLEEQETEKKKKAFLKELEKELERNSEK